MKRIHVLISGAVQGVGYRAWSKRVAQTLGITGWVVNRQDGAVELVAEGQEEKLKTLLKECRNGPEVSSVERVKFTWEDATGAYSNFEIRRL